MNWMIYGANGYTGALVAREAVRRGHRPVLAGRSAPAVESLARELGLESRSFAVDAAGPDALRGIGLVLHCAGPFSATALPMMTACAAARAHYLDITGEVAVFELAQANASLARSAGVVFCPGVGFDVVPTDCIALTLKEALPEATHLALGFDGRSTWSRGTARTCLPPPGGNWPRRFSLRPPIWRPSPASGWWKIPRCCSRSWSSARFRRAAAMRFRKWWTPASTTAVGRSRQVPMRYERESAIRS